MWKGRGPCLSVLRLGLHKTWLLPKRNAYNIWVLRYCAHSGPNDALSIPTGYPQDYVHMALLHPGLAWICSLPIPNLALSVVPHSPHSPMASVALPAMLLTQALDTTLLSHSIELP